jgi:hypothetical protein
MKFFRKVSAKFRECFAGVLKSVESSEDADRLLSYYTRQQVLFVDAKLGATFYLLQVCILAFIVGYILIYKQGYVQWEQAKGGVVTHVTGDAVSVSTGKVGTRYFSTGELTYPGLENGNVFVATRQSITKQMRGVCEDPDMPCVTNADCTEMGNGVCTPAGLCKENSWCSVDDEPEIYEIDSTNVQIWVRSFIQYVKLEPGKLFSTDAAGTGPSKDNTFTLRQLLLMCKPIPVNYEEVAELGATFEVSFRWDCNTAKTCKPTVSARRLDTILDPDNIGYAFKYAEYLDDGHRIQNEVRGLRLFFRTSGTGFRVSVAATIMTISTSMTLLQFALVFADLLLTKVFANKKKYIARKFEKTPDFSEYIEQLEARKACATQVSDIDKAEKDVVKKEEAWLLKFQEEM